MPAQLVALNDGPSILLDKPILLVGRHPECDIQIDSRKVSRRHCCIAQVNDYLVVRDLDSTNGIRINGTRVPEGKLLPGDELTIGTHRYRVVWDVAHPDGPPQAALPRGLEIDDDMLEACELPVPLPEPGKPVPPQYLPLSPKPDKASAATPPSVAEEESFIIPDHLELMPRSGSFPRPSEQPPAS